MKSLWFSLGCMALVLMMSSANLSAQTVSYSTDADVRKAAMDSFNSLQLLMGHYLSWLDGGRANEEQRFTAAESRIKILEQKQSDSVTQLAGFQKEIDQAQSDAAGALVVSQAFTDAFPCAILNLKVVRPDVGSKYISFTTPTATCTAWASWSGQTALQLSRGNFAGQTIGNYDGTPKSAFTFSLPSVAPDSGTVQVWTYDSGGLKGQPRQFTY